MKKTITTNYFVELFELPLNELPDLPENVNLPLDYYDAINTKFEK